MKKLLSLMLVALMLLPILVSCSSGDGGAATTLPVVSPGGDGVTEYASKLPERDLTGESFRIIGMQGEAEQHTNFEVYSDGLTGDVMGDAVYRRNQALQQKYGFTIKADLFDSQPAGGQVNSKLDAYFSAGDDMYDLCLVRSKYITGFAKSGYLNNLNATPNLDFDHPTWNKNINAELTIGDKLYFTTNNFMLQDKSRATLVFYNRDKARSKGYIEDNEYFEEKYVDTNTWTLENFAQLVKLESYDLDGGGPGQIGDHFGLAADTQGQFGYFCLGAGFRFSTNDGGVVSINPASVEMENIVSEVAKFALDSSQVLYSYVFQPLDWLDAENSFSGGRALFHSAYVGSFENLAIKANFEYGVLPFPKYDSSQERYYSGFNYEFGTVFSIPYTCGDAEKAGYMLEALSELAHTTTFPTYIEDKCMIQDAYDEVSAKKLGLVFDSLSIDIVNLYNPNAIWSCIGADFVRAGSAESFKRVYDGKYDGAVEEFDKIMRDFAKLDE